MDDDRHQNEHSFFMHNSQDILKDYVMHKDDIEVKRINNENKAKRGKVINNEDDDIINFKIQTKKKNRE